MTELWTSVWDIRSNE